MKSLLPFSPTIACALVVAFGVSAQHAAHHAVSPQELKWVVPPDLPSGAQVTVLFGNPEKPEVFAARLKAPKGYHVPPHTHPKQEVVTVISGAIRVGFGNTADRAQSKLLPAGGLFVAEPGHVHYVYFEEDSIVQANGMGPFTIDYVNPSDDPRRKNK
jgi:quercetin dioxygenase-like cupin family protein